MAWADKYIGIPYTDKGRELSGFDCWGLVYSVYNNVLGVEIPSYSVEYNNSEDTREIAALIKRESFLWRKVEKPKEFDVVVMRLSGEPWHCGVFIDSKRFLHVMKGINAAVEKISSHVWRHRITGFYRHESRL